MGITNHALGAGIVDDDVFAEPGLPVQQILYMGYTEVRGLALNEVKFGFTDDRALDTCRSQSMHERFAPIRRAPSS